ncbi:protein PLANT CADMIUM RESISTANCE 11 [Senna tora]|uniref:Protein PLANT CADMIUM RESISTANCE 11 n=1 Tax=Senna tora TaxID=362788 RepID=A0A834WLM1_9FABA|nr:protein PLANT CADMIUM RESISTANCE 11 [Senna tora]
MMQLPIVTTGPWSTGLCDCYEDCHSCCLTFFCPCVTFGRIAEALDDGSVPCSVSGTLYALLLTVSVVGCWWVCLYSCFYRTKLRQQYLLEEEPCNDFVVHLIFQQCALCQEYREIQNRGYIMSLGWHGNVERQRRMAISTMNPININMMQPACLESGMIRHNKGFDPIHHFRRPDLCHLRLTQNMKRMAHPFTQKTFHFYPCPPQPLTQLHTPIPQYIPLRHAHQRPPSSHHPPTHRLAPLVVPARTPRQRHAPVRIRRTHAQPHRLLYRRLRGRPLLPSEERLQQNHAFYGIGGGGGEGHVVGYVPSRAVSREEDPGEVAVAAAAGGGGGPRASGASGGEPREGSDAVVVGRGERVLRREAVVEGEDEGVESGGEFGEEVVVAAPRGGADAEAAAVEIDHQRKLLMIPMILTLVGNVEASPSVGEGVDGEIDGGHVI